MIVDLFSGIRGWELRFPFFPYVKGIEKNKDAVETARLNGYSGIPQDILDVDPQDYYNLEGLIGSPPCRLFSSMGTGEGRSQIDLVLEHIRVMTSSTKYKLPYIHPEVALVLQPLRWILSGNPYWVALEQVPSVLPIWEGYKHALWKKGYSVSTGILSAEQFGLGTTRSRAFLIASREKTVTLPVPTHSRFYSHRPTFLDRETTKWRSMADILGWGMTNRPAGSVTAGGTNTGGAEPFGNGMRKAMKKAYDEGNWEGEFRTTPSIEDIKKLHGVPWIQMAGTKTSQYRQLGSMVLPVLGAEVLQCVF